MDIIDYVKITFFPVIYLIKGVKFIFKWFRNKWRDIERSGNFEDKIAFGILYALFLIVFIPAISTPILLIGTADAIMVWLAFSIVGTIVLLLSGWLWLVF